MFNIPNRFPASPLFSKEHNVAGIGFGVISKNEIEYSSLLKQDKAVDVSELTELFEIKKESLSKAELKNAERILKNQETASYIKLHKQLAAL